MIKHFNLQLFEDGSGSGSGAGQGAGAGAGNGGQAGNAGNNGGNNTGSYSFQQAEEIANARAQRPNVDAITKERDDARAELAQMKNSQTLRQKGVREEDVDYVTFKVAALMKEDDKLDFDKAATKFLKDNPRFTTAGTGSYRVKTGTDGSGAGSSDPSKGNSSINDAIRRAARR